MRVQAVNLSASDSGKYLISEISGYLERHLFPTHALYDILLWNYSELS